MAHLVETMFSVKQKPWHGLGVILDAPPTAEDAIVAAGLNWNVEKRPMFFNQGIGEEPMKCPDRFAVVRTTDHKYLGSSGTGWQPLQNSEAFRFFDPFVQSNEASYETAGALEEGKTIWVLAKINRDPIEVIKGDIVNKYVLLTNKHTAGFSIQSTLTPIRVVCNNTLTGAINNAEFMLRANHSNRMSERLQDIQSAIANADAGFQRAAEAYGLFAKKQVTKSVIDQVISDTFNLQIATPEQREQMMDKKPVQAILRLVESGRGSDIKGVRGTVWGLYNAVTEYIQHEKGKNPDIRLREAWYGSGLALNNQAFKACLNAVAA